MKEKNNPINDSMIEVMKPQNKNIADCNENRGFRVTCGSTGMKSFFY